MKQFVMLGLLALLLVGRAEARLTIEITGGAEGALPIAIVPFEWRGGGAAPANRPDAIIGADLARSGRFVPLAAGAMPPLTMSNGLPHFAPWKAAGVDSLVTGRLRDEGNGLLSLEFQLFDVASGVQLTGYRIRTDAQRLRRSSHKISDIIYEKLTGEPGAFSTHIAYITATGAGDERRYRLAVADADGHDEQIVLTSNQPLMSPAWSPDGRRLAYVSFESGRPVVYVQEVTSGQRREVSAHPGINSAPAWSPDGKRLALTLSKDGNPEIYILELASGRLQRVTRSYGIDTEADWASDGRSLVFTSDRGGRPQIYRISLDLAGRPQGRASRVTFEGDYNARARFSPDGKRLVMVHGSGGRFRIGVLELERRVLRLLTDTRLDESPSFAPNGAMVIYATEVGGRGVLAAAAVEGDSRQRLGISQGDVREPAWSPFSGE